MKLNLKKSVLAGMASIVLSGCSVFGVHDVKEPPYTVVQSDGQFEVRRYQPILVASTQVSGNFKEAGKKGFRPLFDYITGDNSSASNIPMTAPVISEQLEEAGQKIPMTAPVLAQESNNQWEYQFVLPESMSFEEAPIPNNPNVKIKTIDEKKMAVLKFTGLLNDKNKSKNTQQLQVWIREQSFVPKNNPIIAGYDPPWTIPFLRRNEILIEIE